MTHGSGGLRRLDQALSLLIEAERAADRVINLVASENFQSVTSRLPMLFDSNNRYFFRHATSDEDYGFRGGAAAGRLEREVAIPILQESLGSPYVSVRPISGLNAMLSVMAAYGGPPGSTCLTLHGDQGGHSATRPLAERLGLSVTPIPGDGPHSIEIAGLEDLFRRLRPNLIYFDQSNALFPYLDLRAVRRAAEDSGVPIVVHVDCSHWLGLILGGRLPNPLDLGADTISGSTHKTFPGPQKGFVATRSASHWATFCRTQGNVISSHHSGAAASLALALAEFVVQGGREYADATVANAKSLGQQLTALGLEVYAGERGYTESHQLWIDTTTTGLAASDVAQRLFEAGIRVTDLPRMPGIGGPGLRLGLQEATLRGMKTGDASRLADIMISAIRSARPLELLADYVAELRTAWRSRDPRGGGHEAELISRLVVQGAGTD